MTNDEQIKTYIGTRTNALSSRDFQIDIPDTQSFDFGKVTDCPKNPDFPDNPENSTHTQVFRRLCFKR